jgi:hypothetical protein
MLAALGAEVQQEGHCRGQCVLPQLVLARRAAAGALQAQHLLLSL